MNAKSGQFVRLDAKINTVGPATTVYWLKNGAKIEADITRKMIDDEDLHTLLILEAKSEDAGNYECVAVNAAGEARCQCRVEVSAPSGAPSTPAIVSAGQAEQTATGTAVSGDSKSAPASPAFVEQLQPQVVSEGQSCTFRCRIKSSPSK